MNKKKFFGTLAIAAMATLAFSSCNKQNEQVEKKSETAPKSEVGSLKIAYVEVDSIMTQYKFCKDYSLILQKKGQNIQSTLASKQQALQAAAANFQQKVQQNAYTREQAEAIQAGLQKQNAALRDSIRHFLNEYNKDKKYSLILSKAGDNLLYADKAFDITNDVVAGLNKAYKPAKALETPKK